MRVPGVRVIASERSVFEDRAFAFVFRQTTAGFMFPVITALATAR